MGQRKKESKINKDAWMNTYADMITLILVFFILLYSMSTIDQEKFRLLVKAFTADARTLEQISMEESIAQEGFPDYETGGTEGELTSEMESLDQLYEQMREYVEQNNLQQDVQLEKGDDVVLIRFMSSLFFEANRATLLQEGVPVLNHIGTVLEETNNIAKTIRIDGHTAEASSPDNPVDNRELSTDRANAVLKYLENNFPGIDPAKLEARGFGMYRPIAPNDSEENRQQNRRVEITVSETDDLQDQLDELYQVMAAQNAAGQ